jgi:UDP-4-amino-4,6-dideoxy-N-acetyl-beta-L-altrosamine transaminase
VTRFVPYGRQCIEGDDVNAVVEVLKSDFITQGPKIQEFERDLAAYCRAKYAVVFNSGTSALHAAYSVGGIGNGQEIITTPISFVATANAALYVGARPVFADVESNTGNLDASLIHKNINRRTAAIIPVHYAGHPVNMEEIQRIARAHELLVIEDACHALGARFGDQKIGACSHSDMAIFSFHPVKHIATGEGGAVLVNNPELYEKLLVFRNHGITGRRFLGQPAGDWYYEMQFLGYNYRMTDIQAALGVSQLRKLDRFLERRRRIAETYSEAFRGNPFFDVPVEKEYAFSAYHLYSIRLRSRYQRRKGEIFSRMRDRGLGVQVHYIPIYLQPYYKSIGYERGLCPIAEEFYEQEISLPIFPGMTQEDIEYVKTVVPKVFER